MEARKSPNIFESCNFPAPERERNVAASNVPKEIDIFNSQPLSNRPKEKTVKKQGNIVCIVCMNKKPAGKLTKCDHKIMCLECAESYVNNCISMERVPACLIEYCEAQLSLQKDSIFHRFSTKTHLNWKAFELKSSIKNHRVLHKCQVPDCPGFVDPNSNQCQLCKAQHCDKCHRMSHPDACIAISVNLQNVDNIKYCKFCSMKISKEGGCAKITCPSCKRVQCYECQTEWSLSHHGCAEYGWLSLPFHFFSELCGSDSTVNRNQITFD